MEKNTIVYPTDFSSCAENASAYVSAIAKALNCRVKIIHVLDIPSIVGTEENPLRITEDFKERETRCKNKFIGLGKKFQEDGIDCKTEVLTGDMSTLLPRYIKEESATLVVMGTTGANTLENKILGSKTYKVLRKTDVPIMAIPENAVFRELGKIVFATDYNKRDLKHLKLLVRIAKYYEASIHVVHVTDENFEKEEEQRQLTHLENKINMLTNYDKFSYDMLYWKNVEERLEILLKETDADMLAMVTRKRDFIHRLFHKSVTKRMVYHTHTPLLVFS